MRNAIMTPKFSDLLSELLKEWAKSEYKAINYTDTYTKKSLLKGMSHITKRVLYNHCIEVQVDKHKIADDYHEWLDKNADRLAKEETELNDAKVKDIPWNRLIANKEWEFWPKNRGK